MAALICLLFASAIVVLDRLHPAWALIPYHGMFWASGWLVYKLVHEGHPESFLEGIEVFVYAFLVSCVATGAARSAF